MDRGGLSARKFPRSSGSPPQNGGEASFDYGERYFFLLPRILGRKVGPISLRGA